MSDTFWSEWEETKLVQAVGESRQKINVRFPGLVVYLQARGCIDLISQPFPCSYRCCIFNVTFSCSAIADKLEQKHTHTFKSLINIITQTWHVWFDLQSKCGPDCLFSCKESLILSAPQKNIYFTSICWKQKTCVCCGCWSQKWIKGLISKQLNRH